MEFPPISDTSLPGRLADTVSTNHTIPSYAAAESLSSLTTTTTAATLTTGGDNDSAGGDAHVEIASAGRDLFLANIEITILSLMFVVAVVGNSLTLMALGLRRRKMTRMHYFILHLCVSDLIVAFGHIFPQIIFDSYGAFPGGYPGDDALCRLVKYLQLLGPYLSSYVLVATAVDRYQAICFPLMNCSWTPRRSQLMIGLAWFCACVCSLPQIFIFSYTVAKPYTHMECWAVFAQPWGEVVYVLWSAIAIFVLPLIALVFTYSCISRAIWINFRDKHRSETNGGSLFSHLSAAAGRQRRGVAGKDAAEPNSPYGSGGGATIATSASGLHTTLLTSGKRCGRRARTNNGHAAAVVVCAANGVNGTGNGAGNGAGSRAVRGFVCRKTGTASAGVAPSGQQPRAHSVSGISRAKMKTIKLTLVVVMCYITCSLPYFSAMVYITWNPGVQESAVVSRYVFTILALLASLNSCVNPWLYLVFNENLANTVRDMLSCRSLIKQKRPSSFVGGQAGAFSRSSLSESRSCTSRVQLHVVTTTADRGATNGKTLPAFTSSSHDLRRASTVSRTTYSNSDECISKRTSSPDSNEKEFPLKSVGNTLATLGCLKPCSTKENTIPNSNSIQNGALNNHQSGETASSLL